MAQLTCKNLSIGYENQKLISNLSFSVNAGDYVCIIGENGAGKTTLMKTILGLFAQTKGDVVFGDGLIKNQVGYLPQQTTLQKDFPANVFEVVISGCLAHMGAKPFFTKHEKLHAKENMQKVGIEHLKKRCFKELSGGQQQRVLLARALCATEKILFLDEPVSGLDPQATKEMYQTIQSLNKQGTTIVMISHDIESAIKFATHILWISKKTFFGTKSEFLATNEAQTVMQQLGVKQ